LASFSKKEAKSQCKRGHEFTKENTIIHKTTGTRSCKKCQRTKADEWCQKNKARVNLMQRIRRRKAKASLLKEYKELIDM